MLALRLRTGSRSFWLGGFDGRWSCIWSWGGAAAERAPGERERERERARECERVRASERAFKTLTDYRWLSVSGCGWMEIRMSWWSVQIIRDVHVICLSSWLWWFDRSRGPELPLTSPVRWNCNTVAIAFKDFTVATFQSLVTSARWMDTGGGGVRVDTITHSAHK